MKYKFAPDIHLYYEVKGSGKQILLLIHGYGASGETWNDIVLPLSAEFTIYIIDLVGFGRSSRPANWDYKFTSHALILDEFIKKLSLNNITVVSHSYGAAPAIWSVLKGNSSISKLVLIDPALNIRNRSFLSYKLKEPFLKKLLIRIVPAYVIAYVSLKRMYYNKNRVGREKLRSYTKYLKIKGSHKSYVKTAEQMYPDIPSKILPELNSTKIPVSILWGEKDPLFPASDALLLNHYISNSCFHILPCCGHIPQEEFPEETAHHILRFIK